MKLKVLGLILITTIAIIVLDSYGMLGFKQIIEVEAHYMQYTCGKNNIDMRVTLVRDSAFAYLQGKVISPELILNQKKLAKLVNQKTAAFSEGREPTLADFTLIGYVKESNAKHCSGAICFKIEQIKYAGDSTFTTF